MDRGFYSAKNINALYKEHYKFLIAAKTSNSFVSGLVEKAKGVIQNFSCYDAEHEVYYMGSTENWPYIQKNRYGNIVIEENRRIYVHIYYNGIRAEEEKSRFSKALALTEVAIRANAELSATQKLLAEKYFIIKETPKRGVHAIDIYRKKDTVEKAFDNLKDRLEMKRTTVHSDETLAGKFFLQFLALIFVSYIHKQMRDNNLYRNYTIQSLLDALDVIERYDYHGQKYHCSEITQKQMDLFAYFGAVPPTTL